jgi:hypothetical protein
MINLNARKCYEPREPLLRMNGLSPVTITRVVCPVDFPFLRRTMTFGIGPAYVFKCSLMIVGAMGVLKWYIPAHVHSYAVKM